MLSLLTVIRLEGLLETNLSGNFSGFRSQLWNNFVSKEFKLLITYAFSVAATHHVHSDKELIPTILNLGYYEIN